MELKSFREILLKKTEDNPYLQTLIKYAKEDFLAEEVIEALLKMAEPSAAMGRGANSAITSYAGNMDNSDISQLHDALGHHVSHYKGALKGMHAASDPTAKAKLRNVADQHLNKIIPMMHLAGRAGKHSGGKMTLDYPTTTPWETNYTTAHRHEHNSKLKEGTKDLGRRAAPGANRSKNVRAVPDYRYLEMTPHAEHGGTERMPHKGGYPFEEIQLGSPAKKDAGQAYLPIEDIQGNAEFTPHPFDKHPIHALADMSEHHIRPEQKEKFIQDLSNWKSGEHHKQWLQSHKEKYAKDPEGYKARGTKKPAHHFEGLPLIDTPHHGEAVSAQPQAGAKEQAQPKAVSAGSFDYSKPPKGVLPVIAQAWDHLPENTKKEIHADFAKKNK